MLYLLNNIHHLNQDHCGSLLWRREWFFAHFLKVVFVFRWLPFYDTYSHFSQWKLFLAALYSLFNHVFLFIVLLDDKFLLHFKFKPNFILSALENPSLISLVILVIWACLIYQLDFFKLNFIDCIVKSKGGNSSITGKS